MQITKKANKSARKKNSESEEVCCLTKKNLMDKGYRHQLFSGKTLEWEKKNPSDENPF